MSENVAGSLQQRLLLSLKLRFWRKSDAQATETGVVAATALANYAGKEFLSLSVVYVSVCLSLARSHTHTHGWGSRRVHAAATASATKGYATREELMCERVGSISVMNEVEEKEKEEKE